MRQKLKSINMMTVVIILSVICCIMAFIAGGAYNRGCLKGYKDAYDKHLTILNDIDNIVAKYVEATAKYDESKYWCDKVKEAYQAKLDSIKNEDKTKKE